jgi:hypothetical protein
MVKQYPHILFIDPTPEDSLGENGEWLIGTTNSGNPEWELFSECREEPSGAAGNTGGNEDGVFTKFSSIIFLPKTVDQFFFSHGTRVRVTGTDGEERLIGTVKRFSSDHFHNRVWV